MDRVLGRLRELPAFLPSLDQVIANLPFLILAMWTAFLFFIGFYFAGGIRDLEETQGKGTSQGLKVSLWVTAALTFVSMVSLAFYLVWRRL